MHVLRVLIIRVDPILSHLIASQLCFLFIVATSIDVNKFCRHRQYDHFDAIAQHWKENIKGTYTDSVSQSVKLKWMP